MRVRGAIALVAITAMTMMGGAAAWAGRQEPQGTVCTWGGTPDAPTGEFSIEPGLTNLPAPSALKFRAWGPLAGEGCTGTMTWVGQIDAGSTCLFASFEGRVRGLPGVDRFWGKGNLSVPSVMYDRDGNVVGVENAHVLTAPSMEHYTDCSSESGFTGGWPGAFTSVFVVLP